MNRDIAFGDIAVVGEREIALGFRLLGVSNTWAAEGRDGAEKVAELLRQSSLSLIMVSETIRKFIDRRLMEAIEMSTVPLVVFIPLPGGSEEESIEKFAKRVLGVDIGR